MLFALYFSLVCFLGRICKFEPWILNTHSFSKEELLSVMLWCNGYHYCTTSFNKAAVPVGTILWRALKNVYLGYSRTKQWKCLALEEEKKANLNWTKVCEAQEVKRIIFGALRNLPLFVQYKKREIHPWRSVNFITKITLLHGRFSRFLNCTDCTKSRNAPHLYNSKWRSWLVCKSSYL